MTVQTQRLTDALENLAGMAAHAEGTVASTARQVVGWIDEQIGDNDGDDSIRADMLNRLRQALDDWADERDA